MSSKGNPYGNAMAENFFSIGCIYRHRPKAFHEADDLIDKYIHIHNHERIQNKTGVVPLHLKPNISYTGVGRTLGQFTWGLGIFTAVRQSSLDIF